MPSGTGERGGGDGVLGEGAVHGVAGVFLLLAEGLPAADAVAALSAGGPQPGDRDPVADGPGGDTGAELLDVADAFVAGGERRYRFDRPVAVCGVNVGVAEPAGLHPHQNLARARLGDGQILNLQGGVEVGHDGGPHGVLLVVSV